MNKISEVLSAKSAKLETANLPVTAQPPKVVSFEKESVKLSPFSDPDANSIEVPPISERLEKLERLNVLTAQRDEVAEALETLQKFEQSPNGGQSVIFRSASGQTTSTQNPVAISAMVSQGVTMLKAKLSEIESQIIF